MTSQPALTPPTKPTEAPRPITIFVYDSTILARAIRRAFVDDPTVTRVYSEMQAGGVEKITVWKGAR
jgi:hypothetical protein